MHLHEPKIKDLIKANEVLKKMQKSAVNIKFGGLTVKNNPFKIIVFRDSSLGKGPNGSTMAGYIMYLTDGSAEDLETDINANVLAWRSRKLRRVARSTFAAETLMATDAIDATYPLQYLWMEVFGERIRTECYTDCHSLYDHVHLHKQITEKRLLVEINSIRESIATGELDDLKWIHSKAQYADGLTKCMVAWRIIDSLINARKNLTEDWAGHTRTDRQPKS